MAPRPEVLLLDEPFSSLDVELRETLAREIRAVLKAEGVTAILVSHNQFEAFAMADAIGVVKTGRLLQWDNAFNLYHTPASLAVADFVGEGVLIAGHKVDEHAVETELGLIDTRQIQDFNLPDCEDISLLLRPDDVFHDDDSPIKARIVEKAFRGAVFLYTLELASGTRVLSLAPSHHDHAIGEPMGIRLDVEHLVAFPKLPIA
jgi:iron(III) transport system ATP-binding protein